MSDITPLEWSHPYANEGDESQRFHRENLVRVTGEILDPNSFPENSRKWVAKAYERVSGPLKDSAISLLKYLKTATVVGLPFGNDSKDRYLAENSLFIDNNSLNPNRVGVSNPEAGRAVTFSEGWVVEDQIYLDHDDKGVGKTKSTDWYYSRKPVEEGAGISRDVNTDIVATEIAKEKGILTPTFLPVIKLHEIIVDGKKVDADKHFPEEPPLNINRLWASNRRINSLYRATSSFMRVADMKLVLSSPEISIRVFNTRINRFLEKVRSINEFNMLHQTNFSLGLSQLIGKDVTIENYAGAFRQQVAITASKMISGEIWHDNCAAQNISISGEMGDWDRYGYMDGGKLVLTSSEHHFAPTDQDAAIADITFRSVHELYLVQAFISALAKRDFITESKFWDNIRELLPENNWAKEIGWQNLVDKSTKDPKTLELRKSNTWEETFKKMTEVFSVM